MLTGIKAIQMSPICSPEERSNREERAGAGSGSGLSSGEGTGEASHSGPFAFCMPRLFLPRKDDLTAAAAFGNGIA